MERNFKGIWIPKEIWLNKNLTLQEKIFFVEIDSLDNKNGCFATNKYFADFFGLSKTRVSLIIKSLIDKKFITSTIIYKEGTNEILNRVLKVCYIPSLTKVKDPPLEKLKDNNIINNTINNIVNNNISNNEISDEISATNKNNNFENFDLIKNELNEIADTLPAENFPETDHEILPTNKNYKKILLSKLDIKEFPEINETYYKIAISFYELFKQNLIDAGASTNQLEKTKVNCIDDIRLLVEIDNYTIDQIRIVFNFLKIDEFWKANIFSTKKLRLQFSKLLLKINQNAKIRTNNTKEACTEFELTEMLERKRKQFNMQ